MNAAEPYIITKLIPFNADRFDACASFLANHVYGRPLSIFELVKHHVMTDVFHVLRHGHQAIGGELQPWQYGPVVEPAYKRLKHWAHCHEEHGFQPSEYRIIDGAPESFLPLIEADPDDLSPAEVKAMHQAAELLRPMDFDAAFYFFHSDSTFMGRAYNRAKSEGRALAWGDIIDAHDQLHGTDLQHLKRRFISYT
jgi:hypothetical protein